MEDISTETWDFAWMSILSPCNNSLSGYIGLKLDESLWGTPMRSYIDWQIGVKAQMMDSMRTSIRSECGAHE